ncbi:MAG: hypothetical protein ACR2NN_02665 [Bryobacteraceae bacterium]
MRNCCFILSLCAANLAFGQPHSFPWSGYGHDAQHTAAASVASQPLSRIHWQTPVDLMPQFSDNDLLIHYGSPLITTANTVIVPVKTGATGGFRVEGRSGLDGTLQWTILTDYTLPPHNWIPSFSPVLTSKNRLYLAGAGGTVYYRDQPDAPTGPTGQIAFFGNANYSADPAAYNSTVMINTPLTTDRHGNIFFGFQVLGSTPIGLRSGIARVSHNGVGAATWVSAVDAAGGDTSITKVVMNCAPGLSKDNQNLYIAVSDGKSGYLVSLDSRTLAPLARVRLKDVVSGEDAILSDDGTASPTVGPDGDVYFGVLENPFGSSRGWLLHFDRTLSQAKIPGAFGWDDTASIVPSRIVTSYRGSSSYLMMTKYNNYAALGGDGVNKIAVLDPNATGVDARTGASVMKEVLSKAGATPDPESPDLPNAVREWCINNAAVDRFTKSVLANSEDGKLYRWDLNSDRFTQVITLTPGVGEAYTPTLIGVDGTVYAVNNATLFAVGQ